MTWNSEKQEIDLFGLKAKFSFLDFCAIFELKKQNYYLINKIVANYFSTINQLIFAALDVCLSSWFNTNLW